MKTKNWLYFGVFIDNKAKQINLNTLKEYNITIPKDWNVYNHHMTIAFNNQSELAKELYEMYKPHFNTTINIMVNGIGISDKAIALRINFLLPTSNKITHITMAVSKDGKPRFSNEITNWMDIKPYTITGTIKEWTK